MKIRALFLVCLLCMTACQAFADALVYQCKMKNGHIDFRDTPCKVDQTKIGNKIVQNAVVMHSIATHDSNSPAISYPRPRPFCDNIDSHGINARYDDLIEKAKEQMYRARDSDYLEHTINNYEVMRKTELRGCF